MSDQDHKKSKDNTSELLKVLPFMSAFPFTDYKISMAESGDDLISLGVSQILINAFGETGKINVISFEYIDGESNISISIYHDDVDWIADEAKQVKKMDVLRKTLDDALMSEDLVEKAKAIKQGRKFSKLINCDNVSGLDFNDVLLDFLKINETVLHSRIKLALQKLSVATINSTQFSERQYRAVSAFLNFQIHYVKILLGIVIAAKIY